MALPVSISSVEMAGDPVLVMWNRASMIGDGFSRSRMTPVMPPEFVPLRRSVRLDVSVCTFWEVLAASLTARCAELGAEALPAPAVHPATATLAAAPAAPARMIHRNGRRKVLCGRTVELLEAGVMEEC